MATWQDVREVASALPEVDEEPERRWRARGMPFAFERPLRPADHTALGPDAPVEVPLAAWVPDLGVKDALVELVTEAWLSRVPVTIARRWLEEHAVAHDVPGSGV